MYFKLYFVHFIYTDFDIKEDETSVETKVEVHGIPIKVTVEVGEKNPFGNILPLNGGMPQIPQVLPALMARFGGGFGGSKGIILSSLFYL